MYSRYTYNILSWFRGAWLQTGYGLDIGFIDHYTQHSELQANATLPLISTLQITTAVAKPFPAYCVFNSRSLATPPNSGDSSVSGAQVILSQPDVHNSTQLTTQLQRHLFSTSLAELNCQPSTNSQFKVKVKVKVKVTFRLAVYRQSVCLGVKPLETHDQNFSFSPQRNPFDISPYVTSSLTRR
jgi:hypothetical protein